MKTIKVYCGTYGKHNSGNLDGMWLNLANYTDLDDFLQDCAEVHKDEDAPEFMFPAIENDSDFPFEKGEPGLQEISTMIEFLQLDPQEQKLVGAWLEMMDDGDSIADALEKAEDHYCGEADDFF